MKIKKYKAVVIGLGRIGFKYDLKRDEKYVLSYSRALSYHDGFELVSGVDIDKNKLYEFEKVYKKPAYHYKYLKRALENVEIVVISVPADVHLKVLKDVISFCKPIMIVMEKPLALNLKQAGEIVQICKQNKILLYVNYFRRIDKGIINLKSAVKKYKFGRLAHVNISYDKNLLENGSHFIDLMLYLLGKPRKINVLSKDDIDSPNFVFSYKKLSVFFKSIPMIDYNLKEMDFVFEKARVRYLSLPDTQVSKPSRLSYFGVRELFPTSSKSIYCMDMERFMLSVVEYLYSILTKKRELLSNGSTALQTLRMCFDISKKR